MKLRFKNTGNIVEVTSEKIARRMLDKGQAVEVNEDNEEFLGQSPRRNSEASGNGPKLKKK